MKWILTLLAFLLVVSAEAQSRRRSVMAYRAAVTNSAAAGVGALILNGDFELFTGTPDNNSSAADFTSWQVYLEGGNIAVTTGSRSGYAANIYGNGSSGYNQIYQSFTVVAGANYSLKYWTRGELGVGGESKIFHDVLDVTHSSYIVSEAASGVNSSTYTEVTVPFTAPSGCTSVQIDLYTKGGTRSPVDDVSVVLVP